MINKIPNNNYIFLTVVVIIASVLIWHYSQVTINEISILTGNIVDIAVEDRDKPADTPKDETAEPEKPIKPEEPTESEEFVCQPLALKILSAGYYYSPQGDQLGIGPLPPMVDVQTNYWIFWEITGNNKDLKNFEISAQLPNRVVWNNKKTVLAGNLQYGEITRKIIWAVDEVEKNKDNYKIGFEIGLIPTEQDTGKILNLLTSIKYKATDESCGETVSGSLNNITTDLAFDKLGSGKGIVAPLE